MLADVHGQVGATARAQVCAMVEEVGGQLVLPEALATGSACGHRMTPAEHEEKRTLLVVQLERPAAVEMDDLVLVEHDRVVGIDRLYTARALRFCHRFT